MYVKDTQALGNMWEVMDSYVKDIQQAWSDFGVGTNEKDPAQQTPDNLSTDDVAKIAKAAADKKAQGYRFSTFESILIFGGAFLAYKYLVK